MTCITKHYDDLVLIDDFISDDQMEVLKRDIVNNKHNLKPDPEVLYDTNYLRMFPDILYRNNRRESSLLNIVENALFSDRVRGMVSDKESLAFKSFGDTNYHETQLTVYGSDGDRYVWHRDNDHGRLMSFVLPVELSPKEYEGGELILKIDGEDVIITPKHNQLILFSAHLLHKVNPIKIKSKDIFKGRVVVNGHIGYRV